MSKTTHAERTAVEPRQSGLHAVKLCRIQRVTPTIRLLTLALPYAVKFLPGQWIDLHIPSLPSPGGFTITSPPSHATLPDPEPSRPPSPTARPSNLLARFPAVVTPTQAPTRPYIELAVQHTSNPPAKWLWQPESQILNADLQIRVGGSFTWPPRTWPRAKAIERVLFVAGGVGVNPFASMLGAMLEGGRDAEEEKEDVETSRAVPTHIEILYSSRLPESGNPKEILFAERLVDMVERARERRCDGAGGYGRIRLHLTGISGENRGAVKEQAEYLRREWLEVKAGRIEDADLDAALGPVEQRAGGTVAYVCGPGPMVDEIVRKISGSEGMNEKMVFYEKWW